MVIDMVKPIVLLAKKNLVHNALKNTKIHEIGQQQIECNVLCSDINCKLDEVISIKEEQFNLKKGFSTHKFKQKNKIVKLKEIIDKTNLRMDSIEEIKSEIHN